MNQGLINIINPVMKIIVCLVFLPSPSRKYCIYFDTPMFLSLLSSVWLIVELCIDKGEFRLGTPSVDL